MMFQTETPAQYAARMHRSREVARGLTEDEAFSIVVAAEHIEDFTPEQRDRFVAANMVIRGEV